MKILVTGGAGYLGSVLLPKLLARGHQIRVVDVGYFGVGHLRSLLPRIEMIREDIRHVREDRHLQQKLFDGCECVIHLAAISNDPSADLNPELTEEVNYQATCTLAEMARERRIRFLFSSSCSVYGEADGELDENGAIHPLTTYAVTKVNAEQALEQMSDDRWSAVVLRNGTLFGYSPRMRFDLVVNIFSLYSTLANEIKIFGDGLQWRPFLHVGDCARAFVHFAELPHAEHRCYNIAHENLRVVDIADLFRRINPQLRATHVALADPDLRDYHVSTLRMRQAGFAPRVSVQLGAEDLVEAILGGLVPDPESIFYRNAKWLKELTQIGSRDHKAIVGLMETMAQVQLASR
jgi:nucleoside-diphosphate-sugar epimerase